MKPLATHCLRGHPRTPENLKANRSCKLCSKEQSKYKPKPPRTNCKRGHFLEVPGPCKTCRNEAKKRYLKAHPEKVRERKKRYFKRHPEKKREKSQAWRDKHPGEGAKALRNFTLKQKGWTPAMVEQTSIEQGGRCMICRQTPKPKNPKGGSGGLVPDHKHVDPPEPRALLCHNCNAGLGQFKDNPELCRAAAEYLEAWAV